MVEISVIIPVYNVEKYLNECLDSIVNQTFEDIEIICINDGSTDGSLDILNEYENLDSRVKVITQENRGVSAARNKGLELACGSYIYFIDSDDYLELDGLEKLYELSEEKNLDLLLFKLIRFDDRTGEKDFDYSNMPFLLDIGKETFTYHDFEEDLFRVDITTYTKLFKRALIADRRFAEGLIFEDNILYFDYIFDAERIHFHDECLYYKRIREDSIISKASRDYTDIFDAYNLIYQKFEERKLFPKFREKLFMRKVDSIYYRFKLINAKYRDFYYSLMKEEFLNQKDEYDNELELKKVTNYYKNIFKSVIESSNAGDVESYLKLNQLKTRFESVNRKNEKLKGKNRKLKQLNHDLLTSNSWKLTKPLRALKRKSNG
jgi:glycosyltransferase involved in cell wall biosynthesis